MRARDIIEAEDPKSFLQQHARPSTFEVEGVYNAWTVDSFTGRVIHGVSKREDHRSPRRIYKFNVAEYKERNGRWPSGTVDLNQISYWTTKGNYYCCPAEIRFITRP